MSLEERSDLVPANARPRRAAIPRPPILDAGTQARALTEGTAQRGGAGAADVLTGEVVDQLPSPIFGLSQPPVHEFGPIVRPPIVIVGRLDSARLVALTSWQFTCEGPGTFRELMQNLDVAMFGTVADVGHPALTDTGHMQLELQDRLGATEQVWYRGPLVPYNLTRDPLGPYHSADQARRVTPETGAEDISYAAAFEAGRLLAAADPRFAQAIMRWRRESYKQSARVEHDHVADARMTLEPAEHAGRDPAHRRSAPIVGTAASTAVVDEQAAAGRRLRPRQGRRDSGADRRATSPRRGVSPQRPMPTAAAGRPIRHARRGGDAAGRDGARRHDARRRRSGHGWPGPPSGGAGAGRDQRHHDPRGGVMRSQFDHQPGGARRADDAKDQIDASIPESTLPPYMEMFLAHLRLLIGVPFDYLVPDARLLPDESIRFFYLDRSWTDRLVDGAIAVGKIGTREQAHHQAHAPTCSPSST